MLKKTGLWRGLTLIFAFMLAVSMVGGSILEMYRTSVDAFFNTRSQVVVTTKGADGEDAWNYVSNYKTAKDAFEGLKEFAIRESQEQAIADEEFNKAVKTIDTDGMNVAAIEKKENEIRSGIMKEKDTKIKEFRKNYLEKKLCSHIDDDVRSTALSLVSEKHQLSKIYSIENLEHSIESRLNTIIPESINNLKNSILNYDIIVIKEKMKHAQGEEAYELMIQLQNLYQTRKELAKFIGERVVNPKV